MRRQRRLVCGVYGRRDASIACEAVSAPPPPHSVSKKLEPTENKFAQSCFTSFSIQFSANSHNFRFRFTFKTCQIVASTNMIHQYHEFVESSLWPVLTIWNHCVSPPAPERPSASRPRRSCQTLLLVWLSRCCIKMRLNKVSSSLQQ